MVAYLAGVPVSEKCALAAALRRVFFSEGKPLFISPESIHRIHGRTKGWTASAHIKSGTKKKPVGISCQLPIRQCAVGRFSLEWVAHDHVVIRPA